MKRCESKARRFVDEGSHALCVNGSTKFVPALETTDILDTTRVVAPVTGDNVAVVALFGSIQDTIAAARAKRAPLGLTTHGIGACEGRVIETARPRAITARREAVDAASRAAAQGLDYAELEIPVGLATLVGRCRALRLVEELHARRLASGLLQVTQAGDRSVKLTAYPPLQCAIGRTPIARILGAIVAFFVDVHDEIPTASLSGTSILAFRVGRERCLCRGDAYATETGAQRSSKVEAIG